MCSVRLSLTASGAQRRTTMKCTVCGSTKGKVTTGLCWSHYLQKRRHGRFLSHTKYTPNEVIECGDYAEIVIRSENGVEKCRAIIDSSFVDVARKFKWNVSTARHSKLYAVNIATRQLLHHLVVGKPPSGQVTDHINGNSLDCRKSNLRFITQWANILNRHARICKSGRIGVKWRKDRNHWQASIRIGGKAIVRKAQSFEHAVMIRRLMEIQYVGTTMEDVMGRC